MGRIRAISAVVAILAAAVLLAGCARTQRAEAPAGGEDREKSLSHYLNGLLFDQKEEYANAILEYQEALQYYNDPAIHHALAKDYSVLGKHSQAIQAGRQAVRLEPENRDYHENLGEIYIRAFEIDSAVQEFRQTIRIDSFYRTGWFNVARLLQLTKPHEAVGVYEQYIDRFGPDWDVYLQLADLHSSLGNAGKAIDALRGMLSLDPGNFEVKKTLADAYLRQDSVDTAVAMYKELIGLRPEDIALRAGLAHAYLSKHDYENATAQFEEAMKEDSVSLDVQLEFGQIFVAFIQKDSAVAPVARELFESILHKHPDDWRPYWFLGALANVMRDDSTALPYFLKITELAPANPEGWVGVATIYYGWEEFQQAIDILDEGKRRLPDDFRVNFLLGISYQRVQRLSEAAITLERAVQLNERSVDALSALALTYDQMARHEDSDSTYERALRIEPENHLILNNYGYSLAERGLQLERALTMAREAVRQQPENQSYLDTIGWIYFRLGQYEEAERLIRKAIDLGNASAVIHEHLGDVYSKMKQPEKAIESWQKALELDGTNQGVREKIERGTL